jgi:hypothetical protein
MPVWEPSSFHTEHPGLGLMDVYGAVVADLPFIPGCM